MHTEMECGRSCARARSNLNAGVQRFSASSSGVLPQGSQCGQQLCLLRGPSSSLWHCRHGQWFQALKGIQGSSCSWFWCVQWWWKMNCEWIHESHAALVGQSRKTNWRKENHHLKDVQNDYIDVKCEILVFSKKYGSWVPKAVLSFNSAKLIFPFVVGVVHQPHHTVAVSVNQNFSIAVTDISASYHIYSPVTQKSSYTSLHSKYSICNDNT